MLRRYGGFPQQWLPPTMASPTEFPTESSIISVLKSSDSAGIHALVSNYLSGVTSSSEKDETTIQSLKRRFLPFIRESIFILRTRLREVSESNDEELILERFKVYKLCLDCLDTLSCSPLDSTVSEHVKSPIKDDIYTIAFTMCSSLLNRQEDNKLQHIMDLLDCVEHECKVEEELTNFLQLVCYCVRNANEIFCPMFTEYMNQKAQKYKEAMTPINLILRLWVVGLHIHLNSRVGDHGSANFECLLGELVQNEKILNSSPRLIGSWHICNNTCTLSAASECKIFKSYILFYRQALEFLCHPLAKSIALEGQHLVTEKNGAYAMNTLSTVVDAFHALCQLIFSSPSFTFEKDGEGFDKRRGTVLSVTLAAFTLSIRTNHKLEENTKFIKSVITSEGIKPEDLKSIKSYLNKIVVALSKKGQPTETAKVLELYCKASWRYIICHRGSPFEGDLKKVSMNTLQVSVAFLDTLIEIKDPEIENKLIDTFENWSNAKDLFEKLPAPALLVKWVVQMELKRVHDVDVSTLYSRLSSSTKLSKRNIGIIIEQELNAYEEMSFKYTERCPKMQMEITKILLQHIYITEDQRFQKAQTLVRQGKALRVCDDGLTDCIKCLSQAIIIMEMCSKVNPICHELGVTYCLRALCTQEAEPASKRILEDVKAALKIWLSISCVDCSEENKFYALSDSIMVLLYSILDLIELKGFMELSNDAYQLLIRIFKFNSVPVDKWLTLLWESRRISHALCVSPVNEAFILNLEKEFGELSTINFWIHNLRGNQSSVLGFQQNFSFLFANSHLSCNHGSSFQTDITVEEVQKAALELISNVPAKSRKSQTTFLAGYLYRDLSQRLMTNGQLIEALSFAKEAHNLHFNLFLVTFANVQKQNEKPIEIGVRKSVALKVMLFDSISPDLKDNLSPWKVMQCYLESTLQLGLIYEMMGNGIQAETHFRRGRDISHFFHFPLFTFAFSYHLGGVYVKQRRWDSAENELQCAKDILNSSTTFCCSKCQIVLEVSLHESHGNLCKSKLDACEGGVSEDTVKNWYTPALKKLTQSEWRNLISCPEEGNDATATDEKCKTCSCSIMNEVGEDIMKSLKRVPETKISKRQSLQNQHTDISRKSEASESVEENLVSDSSCMLNQKESVLNQIGCSFSNMGCWHCLPDKVMKSGLLNDFINLKWEFVRRKLSMKLLTRVVNCLENSGQIDEWRKLLLQYISLLVGRNPFYPTSSSFHLDLFHSLVIKEIPGDVFAIERAEIIQNICWYSLKFYDSKFTRKIFCNLSSIEYEDLASWLMVAFVLAREVPLVFQKVSTLLALMYVVSASNEQFSLPSTCKVLGEDYWSAYFHQTSIGAHFTCEFLSHLTRRSKVQSLAEAEDNFMLINIVEFYPSFFMNLFTHYFAHFWVRQYLFGIISFIF